MVLVPVTQFDAALFTVQLCADPSAAAFGGDDPRPINPRWAMTHVLGVSAFEIGDPVISFVFMEAYDPSFHDPKRSCLTS